MSFGSSPKPPDPYKTADAQFEQNMGASAVSSIMNNPNIQGPSGSTNYEVAGYETITGPKGQKIQVPRYTQTTTLSKPLQQQESERNALIQQLFGQTSGVLGQKMPDRPDWQTGYTAGKLKTGFDEGPNTIGFTGMGKSKFGGEDLDLSYAPKGGFSKDRRRVEEAMMSRGEQLLGENRDSEVARLTAMGLLPGSEKYGRVADQFERSGNDLAMQAILAGGEEQSRMLGEARTSAGFTNQAVGQGLEMDQAKQSMEMARREMENARRRGDSAAYNAALEAYNNAQIAQTQINAGKAGFSNQARQGITAERDTSRNSIINQLMGIMSGAQVNQPGVPGYQGQGVGAPDLAGLIQNKYAAQVGAYNNKMSGIGGIAGSLLGMLPML